MTNNLYYQIHKSLCMGLKIALISLLLTSCGVTKRIVDVEREIVTYKDSTILNVKDSIVLIPVERVVDVVPQYDTLTMETSLAKSVSYVDTSLHILRGSIENKDAAQYEYKVVEIERLVERTDTLTLRETKEIPVEVIKYKRDKLFFYLLGYFVLSILAIGTYLYLKLKV